MATYDNEQKTPATGIVGTVLGGAALALGAGLFGGNSGLFGQNSTASQVTSLQMENSILKANAATDTKLVDVYTELRKLDKEQDATISSLNSRVLALETAAPLREQIVMDQVNAVANSLASNVAAINANIASNTAALQTEISCIQKTLGGITATYVPASQVTPEPMKLYNSWTAPTSTATSTT